MQQLVQLLAVAAILANGVIYGTDVFGAMVQRPALAAVDDRSLTQVMGQIHRVADRRLAAITVTGLVASIATAVIAFLTGRPVAGLSAGIAAVAVLGFVVVYRRVSKPVNTALTSAAVAGRVPLDARALQRRWDSVIDARAVLQTVAVVALCIALITA